MLNGVSSGFSSPNNTPKGTPSTPVSFGGNIFPSGITPFSSDTGTEVTPSVNRSKGMNAWQICPGSINPYPQAFTWSTVMGDEVIAFASGKHVMIYCGNSFLQLLDGHDETVTSVKWSNLHGRIAACSGGKIVIYAPVEEEVDNGALKKSPSWIVEQVINSTDEFECVDWNFYGDRLIVGGKTTMILEGKPVLGNQVYKWNIVWKYDNPTPIYLVAFSPDEKYFATVSKFDRLVKVWYRNKPQVSVSLFTPVITIVDPKSTSQYVDEEEEETFSYIYLPHPRSVTSISWRFKDIQSQQRDEFTANVLLTTSIDNVVRVWSETNENEDLSFYVCSIIEKDTPSNVQWLNTAHEKSPNELLLQYLRKKRKKSYEGDHKDIILESDTKVNLETKLQKASSDTGLFESQTWLGTVQSDGTLMIDLLQGLADFPRRTPKTSMWIKMPNALKGIEDPLNVSMVYKTADDSNLDLGSTTPKILTIYVQSRDGMLSSWELNLAKRPQLELLNVFTGHIGDVRNIECHPSLPIMASLDKENNHLVAWHIRDTPFYCPRDVLTNIQDFQINATNISWFPTSPHLFCSTSKGIEIIHVKSVNPLTHNLSSIYESTMFPPSPSYYNIHSLNFTLPKSDEFCGCMFLKVLPFGTVPNGPEKTSSIGALVVAIASNCRTIGIFQVETKPNDINQFDCKTLIKQDLGKIVSSADCVKGVPFIYNMHKSKTALSSESSIKKYFANQRVLVITLGNRDGSVSVIRLKKQESEVKEIPKPKIGGLLGKFAATTSAPTSTTNGDEEKLILQKWYEFRAEKEPITTIKCCELVSRIATTTASSNNVRIWENESHVTYTLEQCINTENDIVHDFEWLTYGDGQFSLCIGTESKILNYTQSKVPTGIFKQQKQYWKKVTQFMPSVKGHPCSKIAITKDKTIIASFDSSIHVYTKTQQNDDSLTLMSLFKLSSEPSLSTEALLTHRRLVDYHPNFLLELLMDGRFSVIKVIILHLVKHLKIYEDLVEKKKNDKIEEYLNKDKDYSHLLEIPSIKVTSLIKEEIKKAEPIVTQKRRTLLDKFINIDDEIAKEENTNQEPSIDTEIEEEMNIYSAVQYLNTILSRNGIHLPGISKAEQTNLQAVVDTFIELHRNPEALDPSGIRYLVTVKYLQFLCAKRKPDPREESKKITEHENLLLEKVNSSMVAWALLSETQDSLWRMICPEEEDISWKLVEQLGVCYWMNNNSLRKVAERLATEIYKETNDPTKCALYYMAIKKKGALARLFKLKGNEKVAEFLNKDFSDEKCRVAASKNAYTLLSRQDYYYAAAYFLLADNPKDAISILIKSAKEYDLAYFIARLYCGDDSTFCKNMLENEIYQRNTETKDVWMQSIILWTLKKYERSIETLVKRGEENENFDPSLFAFCIKVDSKPHLNSSDLVAKHILPILLRTAHYYSQVGLYTLCLEHLLKLKNMDQYTSKRKLTSSAGQNDLMSGQINMGAFGMGNSMPGTPKITTTGSSNQASGNLARPLGGMDGSMNSGNLSSGTLSGFGGIGGMGGSMNSGNLSSGTLSGFGGMGGMGGMGGSMNSGNLSSGTLSGFGGMGGMGGSMNSGNLSSGTLSGFGGMGGMGGSMNSGNLSSGTLSGFGGMTGMAGMGGSMNSGNLSSGTLSGFGGMTGMGGMGGSMNSGNLSSGTLSGFGGMGGMGGSMNSGNLSSGTLSGFGAMSGMGAKGGSLRSGNNSSGTMGMNQPQQLGSPSISIEDAKEQTELTELLKFKTALTIISQELYDCCYRSNSNYHSDWDKNYKKIMTDIDELVAKLEIDKQMLIKKLKVFTRVNGLLSARCLLCSKPSSILRILESFVFQVENTLSLVIRNQLRKSQVSILEGLLKEYIHCYSRMKSNKLVISEHQQSDLSSTLLTIMFIILYYNRDFEGLLVLFTLHQDFDKKERDSLSSRPSFEGKEVFDKFYHLLFDRMSMFHKKFKKKVMDNKINKAMQEEIEQEEKRKKKAPVNKTSGLVINKEEAEKKKDYYKNLLENYHNKTTKGGNDRNEDLERIEKQFHWEMFDAFVVFKFTTALKDFIEHAYDETYSGFVKQSQKKRDDINKQQYSLSAQTALSCSALWCSHLERRLQYREMEVYTVSEHGAPNLKDVNALSARNNLSSMVETLSHGSKRMHQRTQSSKDHFHSLAHALPELGLEQVGVQQNLLLSCISDHWLEDEKIFDTFKSDPTSQQLWSYLMDLSSKPKPNISSSVSVNSSLAKFANSDNTPETSSEFTKSESDEVLKFSADIEIVKCKELIKSFCVDSNNPSYLAYVSGKCIREINIEHSIRYRKRNPSLDKLLDEEAITWDQSFHRFDDIAAKDVNNTKFVQQSSSIAKVPSISNFNVFDFLDTVNDEEAMSNKNLKKFIGFSNPMSSVDSSTSYMNKLKQRFSVGKRPSFTTTTPSASHFRRQSNVPPSKQPAKKVGKVDRNQTANVLVSHPFLPFYISGGADGSVYMWQYGFQYALRTYREPGASPITNIRFSRFGYKFGVTDTSGYLTLWRFEASKESLHYFYHLHCHGSKVNDFSFLESGSLIATIGQSQKGGELCVWDLFLPNQDAKMFYYLLPNNDEPLALRYSYKYKLLLVGTKKGDIYIFDAEDGSYSFLHKTTTQHDSIQVLNIDVTEDFFVTGCSNGHITVWDMKSLKKQLYFYPDTHPKKKLFTQEGVTWSEISTQFFYTSGGDGRIIRKTIV